MCVHLWTELLPQPYNLPVCTLVSSLTTLGRKELFVLLSLRNNACLASAGLRLVWATALLGSGQCSLLAPPLLNTVLWLFGRVLSNFWFKLESEGNSGLKGSAFSPLFRSSCRCLETVRIKTLRDKVSAAHCCWGHWRVKVEPFLSGWRQPIWRGQCLWDQ